MQQLVTIFHRTDDDIFMEVGWTVENGGLPTFERAYSYTRETPDEQSLAGLLEDIYRENNAVDGSEENVKAQKRSLSVGDVVLVGPKAFSVEIMGFTDYELPLSTLGPVLS